MERAIGWMNDVNWNFTKTKQPNENHSNSNGQLVAWALRYTCSLYFHYNWKDDEEESKKKEQK